jgi:uncharacterized glyoxalase superfamily protein PhnB
MTATDNIARWGSIRLHAVRFVAEDPGPLIAFYDLLLGTSTPKPGLYTEIPTETGVHVSFSRRDALLDVLPPEAIEIAVARGILDIAVDDVDSHIARLRAAGVTILQEPSQRAWGARSATVTAPDGRLVNLFSAASSARLRQERRGPVQ